MGLICLHSLLHVLFDPVSSHGAKRLILLYQENLLMFITGLQPIWKISSIVVLLLVSSIYHTRKKQQSLQFKFAEVKSHLRSRMCKKLLQTYRKLADHLLLFCGIGGGEVEFKFVVPSTAEKPFNSSAQGKEVLYWTNSFFSAAPAKELSSIFFADTADRNPSNRFAASSFFGSDWLNKQPKNSSFLTNSSSLSLSPLSLLAALVHISTC